MEDAECFRREQIGNAQKSGSDDLQETREDAGKLVYQIRRKRRNEHWCEQEDRRDNRPVSQTLSEVHEISSVLPVE